MLINRVPVLRTKSFIAEGSFSAIEFNGDIYLGVNDEFFGDRVELNWTDV